MLYAGWETKLPGPASKMVGAPNYLSMRLLFFIFATVQFISKTDVHLHISVCVKITSA